MNFRLVLAGLLAGSIFGLGLAVSGLANPDKVLQFLTLDGNWSPALLFTMGAGIAVTFLGYRWVLKRGALFDTKLHLPTRTKIDRRLVLGSALFGLGWGLAGFCPGPAVTGLSSGLPEPAIFVLAMLLGARLPGLKS